MSGFNRLTDAEAERLALLMEEAGEVVQAVGKILRHGYASCHPGRPQIDNRADLAREMGDFYAIARLMIDRGDLDEAVVDAASQRKLARLPAYLHHNRL